MVAVASRANISAPTIPQTKLLLGKESPEGLAARLVTGTKLADPAVRKALWEGGQAAIDASTDPMIVYARSLDANDRALQKRYDDDGRRAADRGPGQARRRALRRLRRHASIPTRPSRCASATARSPAGWSAARWCRPAPRSAAPSTARPAPRRSTCRQAFIANRAKIDANATYDFVTTNDIIGGNSGSPVIDRQGRVIGAAFDGNIHSLGGNYGYDGTINRTVVVSTAAVQEALEKIYPAPNLVAELKGN